MPLNRIEKPREVPGTWRLPEEVFHAVNVPGGDMTPIVNSCIAGLPSEDVFNQMASDILSRR